MRIITAAERAQAAELLNTGTSDRAIAAAVGIDRATVARMRRTLDMPPAPRPAPKNRTTISVNEKWQTYVTSADERGHMTWTGRLANGTTPVMSYAGCTITARPVAYRMHTGRDPVGYVRPGCGQSDCVAPAHQEDEQDRVRERAELGAMLGRRARVTECRRGHPVATHRRYLADGSAYCGACNKENKQARQATP
ncbi:MULTISPECIES: helix-turn-helix domain-containing protein [unclassified Streptomyces]|uniref:helix-turn-helix domain-containing protein n=1 Tax=Streptomyces sp. NPDC055082 TaxID=3365718 RepID=UPI0037D2158C